MKKILRKRLLLQQRISTENGAINPVKNQLQELQYYVKLELVSWTLTLHFDQMILVYRRGGKDQKYFVKLVY